MDYNQDGFLDIYLTTTGTRNDTVDQLWRNNGNGTFSRVLTNVFKPTGYSNFGCWADYDNDGDPDVFVGVTEGTGRFYRNDGAEQFTDLRTSLGLTMGWYGAWADYDNDGHMDLHTERVLFWNDGAGGFVAQTGSDYPGAGAANWIDYDNDGYLDCFSAHSMGTGPRRMMQNNRDGTFVEVALGDLSNDPRTTGMAVWADYDNDGFIDVVIANRSSSKFNDLFHNDGNANHWLLVKPVGAASNRSAIGAKVRVQANIWGKTVQQMREISGTPFAGDPRAHFGLGDATQVDLLRIEWPSGIVQTLTNVALNQILTITEHQAGVTSAPSLTVTKPAAGPVQLTATGQTNLRYVFEASLDLSRWTKIAVRTNVTGTVDYTPAASLAQSRFYRVQVP